MHEWNFVFVSLSNHKNYNFFDCDWFKKLLFSTNSLAKLLSDSSISQLHSKLKIKSTNLYCRATLNHLRLLCKSFNAIFPFFITWLFFFSQKLKFLWLIANKISCRPIRAVIIPVINKSDSHRGVVRFCYHSHDNRPNWTPINPITITY